MAINSYWFNSVETNGVHDRIYHATSFAEYLNGIVGSGVLAKPSTNLQVVANTGLTVVIKPGSGWINGYKLVLDADMALTLDIAHATLARIDRVVFAVDHEEREMKIYIKKGTAASSPAAPSLVRTDELQELSLAQIYVPAAATSITQARITDERPSKHCGYISGLIDQVDTATIYDQFLASMREFEASMNANFLDWFTNLKDTLVSNTMFIEKKFAFKTEGSLVAFGIPDSLLYGDALDVLHVYVNGFRLVEGEEYDILSTETGAAISFKNTIPKAGTLIEVTNWKTVGATNVQEIVNDVLVLQDDVSKINTYTYYTKGTNDEKNVTSLIADFFAGTGQFAGIASNQQAVVKIVGKIDITNSSVVNKSTSGLTSFIAAYPNTNTTKKLTLDFSNCIVNVNLTSTTATSIVRIFNTGTNKSIKLKGLKIVGNVANNDYELVVTSADVESITIDVTNNSANIITGIKLDSNNLIAKDCEVKITNASTSTTNATSIVGIHQTVEETATYVEPIIENCYVNLIANSGTNYNLFGYSGFGNYVNCTASITNSGTANSGATGFYTAGVLSNCYAYVKGCKTVKGYAVNSTKTCRYINCKAYADTTCAEGSPVYGFSVSGKLTNCRAIALNSGTGSAFGFYNADATQKIHLINCFGKGYVNASAGSTQVAAGFSTNGDATTQTLIMIGCDCPSETLEGKKQTASVRIAGTTSGAKYSLIGNTFYTAPIRHSATGDDYNYVGNIIG